MGATDPSTGVYVYDETDSQATFSGLLNLGQNATKSAVAALQAQVAAQSYTAPNFAYNANFDIWQRGTSLTATGFCADRWHATLSNTTFARTTFAATESYFLSQYGFVLTATNATNSARIVQSFPAEDVARLRGQTVTFSVPLRASAAGVQVTVAIERSSTANVTTSGTWSTIASSTAAPGTTGSVVSVSGAIPAGSTAAGIRISISTTNISNSATVSGTMAQLEYGTTRSPFKLRNLSPAAEAQECASFFERITNDGMTSAPMSITGQAFSGSYAWGQLTYRQKRAIPIMSFSAASSFLSFDTSGNAGPLSSISVGTNQATTRQAYLMLNRTSGWSAGQSILIISTASTSIDVSAELP